jgi:hypothetical protein
MVHQTLPLAEIQDRLIEDVLYEVIRESKHLIVQLPDGNEVVIKPKLEPLPILEGSIPEGWKDAIYNEG